MNARATTIGPLMALAAVMALVAGCDSAPAEHAEPSASKTVSDIPPPLVPAMDLPANAVDNAVAKLDGIADELMKSSGIPGMAVAVVHGGKTVYAKGFGVKDVRTGDKVDPDTVFQLASLSKPLGSTVVAHQVSQNAIEDAAREVKGRFADPALWNAVIKLATALPDEGVILGDACWEIFSSPLPKLTEAAA